MKKLYQKSQLEFFLLWLLIYIGIQNLGHALAGSVPTSWYICGPGNAALGLFLWGWLKKNGLLRHYGLSACTVPLKKMLWFLPLILISTDNLWRGVHRNMGGADLLFFLLGMGAVGFLEELLVRGFLFQYLRKDSVRQAVWISTLAFSAAHILNLFSGRLGLLDSLFQLVFALALGLLYALVLLKSGSLWPCILSHGAVDMLSAFACREEMGFWERLPLSGLCLVIILGYVWYLSRLPDAE